MCRQTGSWDRVGPVPGTSLPCRTDNQVARIVAVNGTHRLPDALAPLINVRSGAEGDKRTPNVTKCPLLTPYTPLSTKVTKQQCARCLSPDGSPWARRREDYLHSS